MSRSCLGGTWASVRLGREPFELLTRILDLGFAGLVPAPGLKPVDWRRLAPHLDDLPFQVPAIRVDSPVEPAREGLGSPGEGDWERYVRRVRRAAALGVSLGSSLLILEAPRPPAGDPPEGPARDRLLELACRHLHELARALPEHELALTEAPGALCDPAALEAILSDLSRYGIGYWHNPAEVGLRARGGGPAPGECLEILRKFLRGSDLSDFDDKGARALPGTGGVDYGLLAPYMRGLRFQLPTVLEPDPEASEADLGQARSFLEKHGL